MIIWIKVNEMKFNELLTISYLVANKSFAYHAL